MTETRKLRVTNVQRYLGEPCHNIDVLLTIDHQRLAAELGKKAFYNKSKKSRAMRGAIIVKASEASALSTTNTELSRRLGEFFKA